MEYTKDQINVLVANKIIPREASKLQIDYFFEVCKRKKLDPFTKQIHMIERNEKDGDSWKKSYTIQASIDGMRAIAQRNGLIKSVKRFVKREAGVIYGCCEIITKDGGTYSDELSIAEYQQLKKDGTPTQFWKKMPETMIKKCAEESVLRMVSTEDLSGIYGDDEMLQADKEETILIEEEVNSFDKQLKDYIDEIDNALSIDHIKDIYKDAMNHFRNDNDIVQTLKYHCNKRKSFIEGEAK